MRGRVLITGGAGFIGSHVADALLRRGYSVCALDNLSEQVHGTPRLRPPWLDEEIELVVGDVRDAPTVDRALDGVDAVLHLAAAVGTGRGAYEVERCASVNTVGTAVLMEALARRPVKRLVVASSMSVYGEGLYRRAGGQLAEGEERPPSQLQARRWEVCARDGEVLEPVPTPESKRPALPSVDALTKYDQERLCLVLGRAYGVPSVALRLFNVYGPRQALRHPHAGVLALLGLRCLDGRAPLVNEDGLQRRDFVHVEDVARACVLALESERAPGRVFNVGSGQSHSVREVAERLARALGSDVQPEVTGRYRPGDVRHCFADVSLAKAELGYAPEVTLERGLAEFAAWLSGLRARDRVGLADALHSRPEVFTKALGTVAP